MSTRSLSFRFRVIVATGAVLAALGPLAAYAQVVPAPDEATANAIATWRMATVASVDPAFHDVVAASYGQQSDMDLSNEAVIKRAAAEQAAFATLDPASVALIEAYYASVQEAQGTVSRDE